MPDLLLMHVLGAFAAGTFMYWFYFHRFETHLHGVTYLRIFLSLFVGGVAALIKKDGATLWAALGTTSAIAFAGLLGAYGNMLIFRLLLHPLNRFPGPFPARISNLWLSSQVGKSDAYLVLDNLHKKYGPYVRIGSNDLSITDPEATELAYGKESRVTKAPWYDSDHPLNSMHTTRDKEQHIRRRRVWAPAFSEKALRGYEPAIRDLTNELVERFARQAAGREMVNITKWFNLYSFDVMGMLTFGKDYGMMRRGQKPAELALLSEGMQPFALKLPPWLFRMLIAVPGLAAGYDKFVAFCAGELALRVEAARQMNGLEKRRVDPAPANKDVMSWLLSAYVDVQHPECDPLLQADAKLTIVAGSDTTAAALTFLFFHLAQHPEIVARLRAELEPLCPGGTGGQLFANDIRAAPLLNGCINEALRMHPPVPSGLYRLTPPEGMQVGDTYIPGNVAFIMPLYPIGRDPSNYVEPHRFWPERWTTQKDKVLHQAAFAPFSAGPMGCIGKSLALMELRMVVVALLMKFDIALAPGEDGRRILHDTKDHFTMSLGDLDLEVKERR